MIYTLTVSFGDVGKAFVVVVMVIQIAGSSGTFPIEAAMIGARIAPGIDRDFLASEWAKVGDKKMWYNAIDEANDMIDHDVKMNIQ